MAEVVVNIQNDGQEVQQGDINAIGNAARIDEYVIHELFRVGSYDGSVHKGIIPYRSGLVSTVYGSITGLEPFGVAFVSPHRVLVGSRVDAMTDPRANWHDVRSALFYTAAGVAGTGPVAAQVGIASNSSGNPRWDLIYSRIDIDQAATVSRYVKNTTTAVVSIVNANPQMQSVASVGVVQGTPGASPAIPALPADVPGVTYYVPLALIRVANGYSSAANRVQQTDILDYSPSLQISSAVGHATNVANGCNDPTLVPSLTGWVGGTRNKDYMPASMTGMHTLWAAIDGTGSPATRTLDNTKDWRNRIFTVFAAAGGTPGGGQFPWTLSRMDHTTRTVPIHGGADLSTATNLNVYYNTPVMSNSFNDDTTTGAGGPVIYYAANANLSEINNLGSFVIYVDRSSGALMCTQIGSPAAYLFLRIDASSPFANRAG